MKDPLKKAKAAAKMWRDVVQDMPEQQDRIRAAADMRTIVAKIENNAADNSDPFGIQAGREAMERNSEQ